MGFIAVVAVLAVVVLAIGAGVAVYMFPPQSTPAKADVVMVLGPPQDWRLAAAQKLVDEHRADAMLISLGGVWLPPSVCTTRQAVPVTCFRPTPATTAGEATELRAQMKMNGWTSAIVITATPHIARTRFIMNQCVASGVSVIGESTGITAAGWVRQFAYQTGAFVKAFLSPAC